MYWTERGWERVHRSDLDGSNTETLIEGYGFRGPSLITDMALDLWAGKIYWTASYWHGDYRSAAVLRANLDGSDIEILTEYVDHPGGLALTVPPTSSRLVA